VGGKEILTFKKVYTDGFEGDRAVWEPKNIEVFINQFSNFTV
jgi:hypothetical protein